MVFYHVFIEHYVGKGAEKASGFFGNLSAARVAVNFTGPFNENEPFDWFGVTIDRVIVTRIYVFCSPQRLEEIILPDGKPAVKSDPNTNALSFLKGEAPEVRDCTAEFVKASVEKSNYTPPYKPKEKKKKIWVSHPKQEIHYFCT